jgi:hypothetical protein
MRKCYCIFLFLISIATLRAEEFKIPTVTEFNAVMLNAIKVSKDQLWGSKVDNYTTLNAITYDEKVPLFSYHYTTNVLQSLKQDVISQNQIDAMNKFHLGKTCDSKFQIFMKVYGLKIKHFFTDAVSGKRVYEITISGKDCL